MVSAHGAAKVNDLERERVRGRKLCRGARI